MKEMNTNYMQYFVVPRIYTRSDMMNHNLQFLEQNIVLLSQRVSF